MRYLIDGYNLLHALWPGDARQLHPGAWPRFRKRLLDRLIPHAGNVPGTVTVVFDTVRSSTDRQNEAVVRGVHVRFAAGYPSADDLIEELIRTDPAPEGLTVVSDDRRVRDAARRRRCVVCGCLDYYESLGSARPSAAFSDDSSSKPEDVPPAEVERWLQEFDGTTDKD
jgi:hypothetical protein